MTTHLPELEQHVRAAAVRRAGARGTGRLRRLIGRPTALGLLGALLVGGVAGAVLSGGSVDPAITAKLAILRGERSPADEIGALGQRHRALERDAAAVRAASPAMARRAHGQPDGGEILNYAATRQVGSHVPGLNLWLVPRADDSAACLVSQTDAAQIGQVGPCLSRDRVEVGSAPQTFTLDGHTDLVGIVPDGVGQVRARLTDGTQQTITVMDNVYSARFATPTTSVSYESPSGPVTQRAPSG